MCNRFSHTSMAILVRRGQGQDYLVGKGGEGFWLTDFTYSFLGEVLDSLFLWTSLCMAFAAVGVFWGCSVAAASEDRGKDRGGGGLTAFCGVHPLPHGVLCRGLAVGDDLDLHLFVRVIFLIVLIRLQSLDSADSGFC